MRMNEDKREEMKVKSLVKIRELLKDNKHLLQDIKEELKDEDV